MRESKASGRTDTAKKLDVQICTSRNISSAFKQLGGRAGTWLFPEMAWGYCELETGIPVLKIKTKRGRSF